MSIELDYSTPGLMTSLGNLAADVFHGLGTTPEDVCWPVHNLVIQPSDATKVGLLSERLSENQIRPADALLQALLVLNPAPLIVAREPSSRVVGTCRHFALLACALLRYRGIHSRVRCGFATYIQPDQALDHWIVEYRTAIKDRWIRLDPECLGQAIVERPEDLAPAEFLTGEEAWMAYHSGSINPEVFGVCGTENLGALEIRGNAVKDFAALNKVEMLPWDEWGRMADGYNGHTGAKYDDLLDTLAGVCAGDDSTAISALYSHSDLAVPSQLLR